MCGPSTQEKELAANQASFASTLQSNYNTQFGAQADILKGLNASLAPIVAAGPNQTGFSPQELAAKTSQALNTTGANYANAARAVNGQLAGRVGDSGLVSGVDRQIKASLASEGAKTLSSEELGITNDNYAAGRNQYDRAVAGQSALAGLYDPTKYGSLGTSANSSAFDQADKIQQEENQKWADIGGVISGAAGFVTGGGLKALSGAFKGSNA